MSLMTALYSGASGLEANSTELSIVGDNIANANTIGFKGSRAAFADAMAQNLIGSGGGSGGQRGLGVKLQMVQKILTQGSLVNTGVTTDLGIEGNGYFTVKGEKNGQDGMFFTRAGQFTVDKAGYLTNLSGMRVQGYTANDVGVISAASVGDLLIGEASAAPKPTSGIAIKANLQSDAVVPVAAWDPALPSEGSNHVSSTTIYDSLGKAHQVDVYFRKTAEGAWDWHAMTDGGNLAGGTPGTPSEIAGGNLAFDAEGKLTSETQASNFTPAGAVSPQAVVFDMGDPTSTAGTGLEGITQFAAPSATSFMNQDGYDSGLLVRVNIDNTGTVVGVFTNGLTRPLGQVALATFEAPDQLARVGENLLAQTRTSGVATIGTPGSADRGALVAGTLEQSNVDMASEFIRMIAAQRGFQANSKTLTTADQLLAELMTIKR
jgi:flagellar hook protein FlgE